METFEAISKRASVREYLDKPLLRGLIEKLVDAGRRAPSARAVEPWEFVAVTDKKILEKLGEIANTGPFIKGAACCIVVYCNDTKYYLEDGSAATENILLMAADMGLGACWVAGDKKPYTDEVSGLLKSPQGMKLVSLIPIGWPKTKPHQTKNRSLKDVIHWNRFERG